MWLLKSEQGTFFHVAARKEHTVGRKNGSLTLSDDQSISRLHAKFFLVSDTPNSDAGINLIDLGSKYGTYINGGIGVNEKIAANETIVLKHSDTIRFGLQWHKYTVIHMPLLVVVSSLDEEKTAIVENALTELNGAFSRAWSHNCTHFVMSAIMVSVKTVCALATGKHIVTPEFFQVLRDAVSSGSSDLPDPKEFIPESAETVLNSNVISFAPDPKRATLFESLTFVATTPRQMSRLKNMITCAGGRVVLFSECKLSKKDMCNKNIILMQNSASSSDSQMSLIPDDYHNYAKYLTSKRYRCIPESDIGMSMVYCSIEKFCNPMHNPITSLIDQQKALHTPSISQVIVPETQNEPTQVTTTSGVDFIINETIQSPTTPRSSKRLRGNSIDDEDGGTSKIKCGENQSKLRLSSTNLQSDGNKRKEEGVDDISMKENASEPHGCKDNGLCVTATKGTALRNRTLKDMFASKNKTSNKVEKPLITEQRSRAGTERSNIASKSSLKNIEESKKSAIEKENPICYDDIDVIEESEDIVDQESQIKKQKFRVSTEKSTIASKISSRKIEEAKKNVQKSVVRIGKSVCDEDIDCVEESEDIVIEESESFSFDDYARKRDNKNKPVARTSVDMFDCTSTSRDGHNFTHPDVPKSAEKKKDMIAVKSVSNNKNVASSSKSIDIFNSSIPSTSGTKLSSSSASTSTVMKRNTVKESSDKDFDFSDEDEPNKKKPNKASTRSADMFSVTPSETTITEKQDESDDFDFPDANETRTSHISRTRNSNSNQFSSTFATRKTKRNQKQDDFDFPDEAPSPMKRSRQSSIFSGSLFSDTKKVTVKTERTDSFDDDTDFGFGDRNKRNGINGGMICLSKFIDRHKKPDNSIEGDGNENDFRIKEEPVDNNSDDSGDENVSSHYSADVIIMPMIVKLSDLNINKRDPKDENSTEINYKKFKKNKVAGSKQLPKIIKVSFIDAEDHKNSEWQTALSESEEEIDDDFDFGEIKRNDQKTKKKLKR